MSRLLFSDYSEEQLFFPVEVGIEGASGIPGIFRDLLRNRAAEAISQKMLSPYRDQYGASLRSALLACKPFFGFCDCARHFDGSPLTDWTLLRVLGQPYYRTEMRCGRTTGVAASPIWMNTLHPDTTIPQFSIEAIGFGSVCLSFSLREPAPGRLVYIIILGAS